MTRHEPDAALDAGSPRGSRARAWLLGMALVLGLSRARPASAAELSDGEIVAWGAGMAVPAYFLGVTLHEGSHALAARAMGAEITEIRLLPGFVDGHFYFGYTRWRGRLSRDAQVFALVAPKLTDLALLGAYAWMLQADALPDDDRGELAIGVIAAAAWVDIVKDTFSFNPTNDIMRIHALHGRKTELERLPLRIVQLGVVAGGGYLLLRGAARVFDEPDTPALVPLFSGRF